MREIGKIIKDIMGADNIEERSLTKKQDFNTNIIPTGVYSLDLILGGGLPGGYRTNIFGPEASGKSSICYNSIKQALDQEIDVVFFDPENGTEPQRLINMGLDLESPYLHYFNNLFTGEQIYGSIKNLLDNLPEVDKITKKTNPSVLIIIDSLASMLPVVREESPETGQKGIDAAMHSIGLKMYKGKLQSKNAVVFDTNQLRQNPMQRFGSPWYEPGGNALKHYSDIRIEIKKCSNPRKSGKEEVEDSWDGVGIDRYNFAKCKTVKNKVFSPYRECNIRMCFETKGQPGYGVDPFYDVYEFLKQTGQGKYIRGYFNFSGIFKGLKKLRWAEMKKLIRYSERVTLKKKKLKRKDIYKMDKEGDKEIKKWLQPALDKFDFKTIIEKQLEDGSAYQYLYDTSGEINKRNPTKPKKKTLKKSTKSFSA
jgi:RecA/RadA recombinase